MHTLRDTVFSVFNEKYVGLEVREYFNRATIETYNSYNMHKYTTACRHHYKKGDRYDRKHEHTLLHKNKLH